MTAQKRKKNLLTEIFGTFESALTQNSTNQEFQLSWFFRIVWKTVRKSKNMGLQRIFSTWKWFQILLHKFQKMDKKRNFMVFRDLFLF